EELFGPGNVAVVTLVGDSHKGGHPAYLVLGHQDPKVGEAVEDASADHLDGVYGATLSEARDLLGDVHAAALTRVLNKGAVARAAAGARACDDGRKHDLGVHVIEVKTFEAVFGRGGAWSGLVVLAEWAPMVAALAAVKVEGVLHDRPAFDKEAIGAVRQPDR